jgi:hypothetical protein
MRDEYGNTWFDRNKMWVDIGMMSIDVAALLFIIGLDIWAAIH